MYYPRKHFIVLSQWVAPRPPHLPLLKELHLENNSLNALFREVRAQFLPNSDNNSACLLAHWRAKMTERICRQDCIDFRINRAHFSPDVSGEVFCFYWAVGAPTIPKYAPGIVWVSTDRRLRVVAVTREHQPRRQRAPTARGSGAGGGHQTCSK